MLTPDLDLARRFVADHHPAGEVLLCGVTGAHHYGFPSADSDIDLKGIHLAPTRELLGLDAPGQTFDRLEMFEGAECDLTLHEADKALRLLLGGNGNMLERILTPLQLFETDALAELQPLARAAICQRFGRHYRGFFSGMCREHEAAAQPGVKSLLYSYRVALTGIHLMRSGELEANINRLAPEYGFASVLELVAYKREHAEKSRLPTGLDQVYRAGWPRLAALLDAAIEDSSLAAEPTNRQALSDWLVAQRLAMLV